MNKQEIVAEYKRTRGALDFEYKTEKTRRLYAHRMRKADLKFKLKTAAKPDKKECRRALKDEKREYKKEAYLQKGIYLEKKARLKKKKRDALGSVVRIVSDHAPESLVGGLMLHYILIFLLFGVLQAVLVTFATNYVMENRATDTMRAVAASLEAGDLKEGIASRLAEENGMNITLCAPDGKKVYSFGLEELEGQFPYNTRWEDPFTHRQKTVQLRIYSKKTAEGYGLNLAKNMQEESAILSLVVNLMLFSIAGALIISYVVGYRITKKQLRPIGILGRAMEQMSAARLSDRLETENIHTELVEVVHSYNGMLDKIEDAYERQKQFVSDASHELRTPLAVIRGYADILSRWGAEEPEVRREAVDAILAQSANMETLLERLLYIARSENGKVQAQLAPTALEPICRETLQDFKMMHPDREFILEGEATALCDEGLMRQLLTILLDNAAKFTKEGGKITLRLGGEATVTVADDGVGMAPEVAERVFERFYKGDSSHNEKGYGLGLSIARLIAESQGGKISVQSAPGKGTNFYLELKEP